ncbi:MAG: hypothetical protein R6W76_11735 [Caldilinea sp.]
MNPIFRIVGGALLLYMVLLPHSLFALPSVQAATTDAIITLPVVVPAGATAATLHTHLATISFDADAQGTPLLRLDASYDIRNETKEAIQLPLRIANDAPTALTLTQDGAPLALASTEDGGLGTQISIPADGRAELELSTSRSLVDLALMRVVYPTELLRQWRGQRSIRVELAPGSTLGSESWLHVEPDSWAYAPFASDVRLEWMFEGEIPPRIIFQTVAPGAWQELRQLAASAVGNAPSAHIALGQRYHRLAAAAAQMGDATEERFLAQAVAAYTEGVRKAEAAGAAANDLAGLHAGLAELYRDRIAGAESATYAQAMVAEAGLALRGVMVDDPRRAELEQWQVDGLRLMLADLRRRGDIPGALALIEQLRALTAGASGSDFLEQERQALVVQQAVQLVEQGDRTTALALAGDLINAPALQPPAEYRNLFTRWDVSTTMSARGVEVRADVHADDSRTEEAQAALDKVVQTWRTSPALRAMEPQARRTSADGEPGRFELTLHIPAGSSGVELSSMLPPASDWALLRQLLGQLGPQIRTQTNGVWQQVQVAQPLDLRAIGEQWRRIATELDNQAEAFEQDATQTTSAATMQTSQEARLRAANYRYAAQSWRELAQNSQVIVSLSTPGASNNVARTWMVTLASPPQMLNLEVDAISGARVLVAVLVLLSTIFGLAALLWRLL